MIVTTIPEAKAVAQFTHFWADKPAVPYISRPLIRRSAVVPFGLALRGHLPAQQYRDTELHRTSRANSRT